MSPFIERLGWVLIHSLWQLALLAAAAFVVQRAMQRTSATARYAALLAMLVLVVAAPLITWSVLPTPAAIPVAGLPVPAPALAPVPVPRLEPPAPVLAPAPVTGGATAPIMAVAPAPLETVVPAAAPEPLQPTWSQWAQQSITPWLSTIVLGWSLGVLAFAIRPLWSWFTVRQLRTQGVSPVSESVQADLAETARRLGVTQAVRVFQSTIVQVPIVAGYLKPVILLPASIVTGLPASQLEAILAHELAHIRRHDYLANLIQTLVETVFFYHPAVWWLSHQIRCERENCCDDIAVALLGSRLDYSRALLAVEELRGTPTALAVGASGGSLLGRVSRLFHRDAEPRSFSSGSVALGVTLVSGVLAIAAIAGQHVTSVPKSEDALEGPDASGMSWAQLGGNSTHNPVSAVTNLPTSFNLSNEENIRWSQPIGDFAFSSPVVSGGKLLIGTNNAIGRDPQFPASVDRACLQCFDERTGEFLWQYSSPKMEQGRRHDWPSIGICSTPVIEGDRVWFATNRCEIVCLDLNGHRDNEDDGEPEALAPGESARSQQSDVVWKYDMFNTLGVRPLNATCVTPAIAGDLLLLNSGNDVDESYRTVPAPEAPAFLALHKTTGQLIWSDKTPNPNILGNGCSMGAPAVAKIGGVWQVIFAGYDGWLYSFDLAAINRGETQSLWTFDLNPKTAEYRVNGPRKGIIYRAIGITPVVAGDRVFAAVGHNPERGEGLGWLWCIDATKRGDLSAELVYNKGAPDVVIPHKRVQACESDKGDFTRPNPNSGVEWVYTYEDTNRNGEIEFDEEMHLSNSLPAIHEGLLLTADLAGLVHCLDVNTGRPLWTHDQLAACWSGPLIADGKAWVIDEDGDLSIFAISRKKQLIAEIAMNSSAYTNIAAANQTLYVAMKNQLVAIGSGEFPQLDGVTAKLPGGLEIELVGVTPNSASTSEGWCPDGSPIVGAGDWPRGAMISRNGDRFTVTTDSASKLTPDPLARDLLFECRGATSSPSWTITQQNGWIEFQALNVESGLRRRLSLQRKDEALNTTVEMAYTDSPWGPWQQIGVDGNRINTIETFGPDQQLYGDIRIVRIGSTLNPSEKSSPLELVLNEPATGNDYQSGVFAIEVRLVGKNQKVLPTYAQPQPMKDGRRSVTWRTAETVPLESLQYAEFRLRPYRHFITFENVPLEKSAAGKTTVKHRSMPEPPRRTPDDRFVARLPDGMEIELLRIVRNDLPEEKNWLPNGEVPTAEIDWPNRSYFQVTENSISSSNDGPGSDRVWDVAYAYRPASAHPLVSVEFGGGSSNSATSLDQIGLRTMSLVPKDPAQLTKLQFRVGNEPWGQWIQVDAEGGILNPAAINDQPNSPDTLIRIVGAGIDEENPDRSWIKWLALPNADQLYSMEVRAIDDDGNIHEARHRNHKVTVQPLHEMTYSFELSAEKLNRFEYRLRPYRRLVTFDQICTDPAKPTAVKVSVEKITYPEEVTENAPIEKSRLLVLNADNTTWQGSLVAGHIGFIPPDSKAWNAWVGKDGQADLSALPAGKHWLISRFPWSVIPVETPLQQTVRQPLRLGTPPKKHSSRNYSGNLSVQQDEQGREFIQCDFSNNTDELWSFSELDLTLEAGWFSTESHGHSPQWLGGTLTEVPQIEIPPGQKGSLRIDWSEWAKRGVWDPMSGPQAVSKPVLPDQEPGKIWVRISGPGFGTNPVAVTHPDKLLAVGDEAEPQPPARDELDGPRIDLIGLTYDSVPKKETWNTNGQPLPAPDWVQKLPKLYGDDKSKPAPLYLFEVHGLRAKPSFRHRYQPAVVSGDDEVPEGRPYRMAVLYEDLKPEERNQFIIWGEHPAVRITDEPWGPWRTITKEGQFAEPVDPNTLYREGYEMVTLHGFRPLTKKPNDPELAPAAVRTSLVLKHPMDYDALYAIEIEAVPSTAGPQLVNVFTSRPVQRFRNEVKDRWDVESEWPVDPTKIDHLRYRIRPFRHRFEFQEVAYKQYERPATSAPFKVIHTKLEHDLPKPVVSVQTAESSKIQDKEIEQLVQVEQLFEKVSQCERDYGDFEVTVKTQYQIEHEPAVGDHEPVVGDGFVETVRSTTVEHSLIAGRKYHYAKYTKSTSADNQTREYSESSSGECFPQTLQAGSALRPHQLQFPGSPINGFFLINHLHHYWSNGHLKADARYQLIYVGDEQLRGLECVKVQLFSGTVLRQELWLAKERHFIPIRRLAYNSFGVLSAMSEVTEFQELNPGRWFPKRFVTITYETDNPVNEKKVRWRNVSTLERHSAKPVWVESDLSQFATDDQRPTFKPNLPKEQDREPGETVPRPATSAPSKVIDATLEHDLPKPVGANTPSIELQVVDAETGQPIAGAEVTVRQAISSWQPKRTDAATAKLNISTSIPEFRTTATTNVTGQFSFTIPRELRDWQSDLQISARHPDYVIEQSFGAFQVTPEMAADPSLLTKKVFPSGLIRLKRGHEISGQILGPDGQPAAGVKLYAAWQMPQYLDMPPHAVTDAQGRYKFRTVKETESDLIFAIPQDAVAVSFPLKSKYGEHPTIQLERGTVITGQVLGQDGKPLAGAVVQGNGSDSVYDGFPKPMARVLTDSKGRYRLPPQKLPVDVRVSSLGWMGGWQPRGRDLAIDEVFMPVMVRDESQREKTPVADASGSRLRTLDFRPCETVTLTAHVHDEKGQPATDCELAVFGTAPDSLRDDDKLRSAWRGRFHAVADQPGLFRVKAPKGLVNATLVDPEIPTGPRQKWTRATGLEESIPGPRTKAGWGVLWNDDDSIIVGEPAKTALINSGTDTSGPEPDQTRDIGEWGPAIDGLRSRLRLIRDSSPPPVSSGKVGQPVFVALEIENVSEAEKQLSVSSVFSPDEVQITGPDGKPCPDVRGPISVQVRQISIPPGETKAVIERADLTEQFLMTEPGEYRIRAKSPTVSNELSSGDLRIMLAEGEVSPIRGVYREVQSKAPAGSLLVLVQDQLWVFVSGQTKSTDPQGNPVVKLWHRKDSVPAEELPQGAVELKVPNGSGHWYAEIPAGVTQQWKTVEQDLPNVCKGVTTKTAKLSPQTSSGQDTSQMEPVLISELGLWGVPVSAGDVLALGVTRIPPVPGGVRITAIEPGGYIDSQIKAEKLKFAVGEVIHSVAARDVVSAKDISRNILATRREGHSGFFVGTASATGQGRFGVEFSELLTDPQTGQLQLPPLAFHVVAANAIKEPVDESGHTWFLIGGDFSSKRYENVDRNWDHLKLPVEKTVGNKRLGLVGDSAANSILWDGSWHVEKCELFEDPRNPNQFLIDVTIDSHGAELLRKLTTDHHRERLAIVVEEQIVLAPTILSVIESQFSITGKFTKAEGEQLVQAIRRGMLNNEFQRVPPVASAKESSSNVESPDQSRPLVERLNSVIKESEKRARQSIVTPYMAIKFMLAFGPDATFNDPETTRPHSLRGSSSSGEIEDHKIQDVLMHYQRNMPNRTEDFRFTEALLRYGQLQATWKDAYGKDRSTLDLVRSTLRTKPSDSINVESMKLTVLAVAWNLYQQDKGSVADAELWTQLEQHRQDAVSNARRDQLPDGSWPTSKHSELSTTSQMLKWIVEATPPAELGDDWITRAVESQITRIADRKSPVTSPHELLDTIHTLRVYRDKRFGAPMKAEHP